MTERLASMAWVVWAAMRSQRRAMRGNPFNILLGVAQPVVFLTVTAAAYRDPTADELSRLAIGVALTALWGSTIWAAGGILRREHGEGTLAAMITGVRSPYLMLFGKSLAATTISSLFIAGSVAVSAWLLGLPLRVGAPWWTLLGVLLAVVSGTALGMLLSCLFLVTRHGWAWSSALMYPVFIVGGMMLPLPYLPVPLQWVSTLISLRWAAEFLAGTATDVADIPALLALIGLTVVYLVLAAFAFRAVVRRALRTARLDLV